MAKKIPQHRAYKSCEYAFIEEGYTAKAIADMFDVSEATLVKWRKDNDWDRRRSENLAAPHKIREILLKELQSIAEGKPPRIDADALAKISKVIGALEDRVSIPVVISVFKGFDNWLAELNPQLAAELIEWHKKYLLHRAQIDS